MGTMVVWLGPLACFLGTFGFLVAVLTAGRARGGTERTLKALRDGYRVRALPDGVDLVGGRWAAISDRLSQVARALTPGGARARLVTRLDQAGNPRGLTLSLIMVYKGAFALLGALLGGMGGLVGAGPRWALLWGLGLGALGLFGPNLLVTHLAQERQEQVRRTLPDILDTLVITVEAGLAFEAAVAQVVASGRGPLVGEFARLLHEMQLGRPRVEAVRELGSRTTVPELRSFASAVVHGTTLGIPLAGVLRQQAGEMRQRRRHRAEELAQKVPVKILFPVVFCVFPALFAVVIGPGIIRALRVMGN